MYWNFHYFKHCIIYMRIENALDKSDAMSYLSLLRRRECCLVYKTKHSQGYWYTTETNRDLTSVTTTATIPYIKGTSETIARILQLYNIRLLLLYDIYWPTSKTKTNLATDRERFIRSNALTARSPTLVRLVGTVTRDWLNTNEQLEMAMLSNESHFWTSLTH